jgi:hypothetical protein
MDKNMDMVPLLITGTSKEAAFARYALSNKAVLLHDKKTPPWRLSDINISAAT